MPVIYAQADIVSYFNRLISKVYKVLPIFEESFDTKDKYLDSLIRELTGAMQSMNDVFQRTEFMTIINTLLYLKSQTELDAPVCRTEVFKCINIIKKIGELYEF